MTPRIGPFFATLFCTLLLTTAGTATASPAGGLDGLKMPPLFGTGALLPEEPHGGHVAPDAGHPAPEMGHGAGHGGEHMSTETAGYDHGFFIRTVDDAHELHISSRLQTRLSYEHIDHAPNAFHFAAYRARLTLDGHTFSRRFKYKFQTEFGKGFVYLKDFYTDIKLSSGLALRVGQSKRPFSRHKLTSASKQAMVDRAITNTACDAARDIGLQLHNFAERSPTVEWNFGIYNGVPETPILSAQTAFDPATGQAVTKGKYTNIPDRWHPMIVGRMGYNYGKIKGYSDGDLEGGPLRLGVGASVALDLDFDDGDDGHAQGEVDFALKSRGFAALGEVILSTKQDGGSISKQDYAFSALLLQAGYLVRGFVQPVVRYALVMRKGAGNDSYEATAGVTVYINEHYIKWSTDFGALINEDHTAHHDELVGRSQLQITF